MKALCVCGVSGTERAVTRHTMQCEVYRERYRANRSDPALDIVAAATYAASEQGRAEAEERAQDARDAKGMARREAGAHALAVSRSRWDDGKGGFADGVPVNVPDGGVLAHRAPPKSSRAAALGIEH